MCVLLYGQKNRKPPPGGNRGVVPLSGLNGRLARFCKQNGPVSPTGRAGSNLLGKGFGRGIRNTSRSRFGPSVALLRVRPLSSISARRETHVSPASHMKIGYQTSSSSPLPPNQSRRISPMILVCTKIRLGIGPHSPSKFFLTSKKLSRGNPPFENQGRSEVVKSGVKKRIGSGALPSRKLRREDVAQNRERLGPYIRQRKNGGPVQDQQRMKALRGTESNRITPSETPRQKSAPPDRAQPAAVSREASVSARGAAEPLIFCWRQLLVLFAAEKNI